jgi:hypothetical protein
LACSTTLRRALGNPEGNIEVFLICDSIAPFDPAKFCSESRVQLVIFRIYCLFGTFENFIEISAFFNLLNETDVKISYFERVNVLDRHILSIPDCLIPEQSHILSRPIAGIELVPVQGKQGRLGRVMQLAPGSQIDLCGDGYDVRTVKVHCGGKFYFVFLQDLQM